EPERPGEQWRVVYEGGLARVARVMKLASVASVVGATAAVPLFFAAESDVPMMARAVLAATTLGMTGTSTGLLAWALRPYITSLAVLDDGRGQEIGPRTPLLVDTMTILARRRTRLVFPQMLGPSTLPLTTWAVQRPDRDLADHAAKVLAQINARRRPQVALAQPGDVFYAHTQGQLTAAMQKIIAATSGPDVAA
ncbi:hypothetical protein H4R19_004280, partial [Coemansia spiralis]